MVVLSSKNRLKNQVAQVALKLDPLHWCPQLTSGKLEWATSRRNHCAQHIGATVSGPAGEQMCGTLEGGEVLRVKLTSFTESGGMDTWKKHEIQGCECPECDWRGPHPLWRGQLLLGKKAALGNWIWDKRSRRALSSLEYFSSQIDNGFMYDLLS